MIKNNIGVRRKIWFGVLPILAIAVHFLTSNIFLYGVYDLFLNILHVPQEQFMKFSYLAEMLVYIVLILIFFIIYKLAFKKDKDEIRTAPNLKDSAISFTAGAGVSGFSFLWVLLAEKIPALQGSLAAMDAANKEIEGGSSFGVILIAVVAAPLIEEILFRGIVFRSIRKIIPGWVPIILSAAMFGAYHMNMVQAVYATFMGIVAAIIYEKTNNLMYPILVHVANNLIGAIQSFISSETGVFILNMVSLVMIITMCCVIYRLLKRNCTEQVYAKKPVNI